MTLQVSSQFSGIKFDNQYFAESDVAMLATGIQRITVAEQTHTSASPVANSSNGVTEADVDTAISHIRKKISNGEFEPEVFVGQDIDALATKAREDLINTWVKGEPTKKAQDWLQSCIVRVQVVRNNNIVTLEVDGDAVLQADTNTAEGQNAVPIFELAMVALDLIFVICALAGIAFAIDGDLKKAVQGIVKNATSGFMKFAGELMEKIKPYLPEFKTAGSKLGELITKYIKAIANGIWCSAKFAWEYLWAPVKLILAAIFSNGWALASAILSLGAFLVGLIATAGAALVAALLSLIAALCSLVNDCLVLAEAMSLEVEKDVA